MVAPKVVVEGMNLQVLKCFKEQRLTLEEIWKTHTALYPRIFIAKMLMPHTPIGKIKEALDWLTEADFVHKELTNYTDRALKEATMIYWISDKGRSYLHRKK